MADIRKYTYTWWQKVPEQELYLESCDAKKPIDTVTFKVLSFISYTFIQFEIFLEATMCNEFFEAT
jgi:hypothetical protein